MMGETRATPVLSGMGLAFALGVAAMTACGGSTPPAVPIRPPIVTVEILNATIAPAKVDGRAWDGLPGETVPHGVVRATNNVLGLMTGGQQAAATILADLVNMGCNPPDVAGTAMLFINGVQAGESYEMGKVQDNFTPGWLPGARWAHVPLDDRTRIRLTLVDKDLGSLIGLEMDDPIGDVELSAQHLREALASKAVYQVRVADQHPQVLFVGISVMAE